MPILARLFRTSVTTLALFFAVCATVNAATFTVTNLNDTGMGSLRQAILDANATPGFDTINFSIGSGTKTLSPLSPLPTITDPASLDATTQPGYNGAPIIELNGVNAGFDSAGIRISAGASIVQGFVINRFTHQIVLETGGGNNVAGNYIGISVSGTSGFCCTSSGVLISNSPDNLIGGTTVAARNIISGNNTSSGNNVGVHITGESSTGNRVQVNFIGTDVSGTVALGNSGSGVFISGGASGNFVGGTTAGAGNVISGNRGNGVSISAAGNRVQGNYIGIDINGTAALGNGVAGVSTNSSNNLIGGTIPAARNIISGNNQEGVDISRFCCSGNETPITGNLIQGNYIGLNAAGNAAVPNNGEGVRITTVNSVMAISDNVVGGTTAGAGNVISGNHSDGIELSVFNGGNNAVQGNFIGTNASGTSAIPNDFNGIHITGRANLIGGTAAGARNVISGNGGDCGGCGGSGILIIDNGNGSSATGNVVQGNYIGTDATGIAPLRNLFYGIAISNASGNTVGGSVSGAGNVIAYNIHGVLIGANNNAGINNQIRGNSIHSNTSLGIDLGINGATPNDAGDADTGVNNLQNFPVVLSVSTGGGSTNVQGTLNSAPNASYAVELFASNGCDPSGHGEGQIFLGATTANTDASGNAAFTTTFPVQLAAGQVVTATATDANGNTSEFSVCNEVDQPGHVQFSASSYTTSETSGSVVITVVRTLGTSDTASVDYSTSDGSATANADYTPASGTLTFASGETTKTFTIQILDDALGETPETVNLTLSNASGSTLGSPSTAVLNITDNEPIPDATINNVTINEESFGSGASAIFTVRLSAASNNTVTVHYVTQDNSAQANLDYTPVSGQVTFTPGQTTRTISVPIIGDTIDESNESFVVFLDEATNANVDNSFNFGFATIIDNDPDPGTTGELLITEFRPSGPAGLNDEFVEIYNNTNANIDLRNYSLVFLRSPNPAVVSFATLQGATILTPRSHRLMVNSTGYSLNTYATASFTVTGADFFADNQGIALRRNGTGVLVDAVGFTDDPVDFREGAGLPVISEFPATRPQYSYVRKLGSGTPQDTGDNADDFALVTTTGEMISGVTSMLGAPGPQNQASPVQRNAAIKSSLIDSAASPAAPPNRIRTGAETSENAAYGTLTLRRKFTNTTGATVTRLRFRVVDITTAGSPNPSGNPQADLRVLNSTDADVDTSAGTITVTGTMVEQPPTQTMGGGLNSGLTVQLPAGGLPNNSSINVQFVLGVQQEGNFRFFVNVEALPAPTVANPGVVGRGAQKGDGGKASEPQ